MSQHIILKFRNAKLFRNKRSTKDKVIYSDGVRGDKSEHPWWEEPITVYQVSNLLHVLFGERPVPSVRTPFLAYGRDEKLFELAKECHLKVDSLKLEDSKGNKRFVEETVRIKKAVPNAWAKQALPTSWQRIREYTGEHFDAFVEKVDAVLGRGQLQRRFSDVHRDLVDRLTDSLGDYPKGKDYAKTWGILASKDRSDPIVDLMLFLKDNKMTILGTFIIDRENQGGQLNMSVGRAAVTVVNGVDTAAFISGSIIVPVDDRLVDRVRNHAGCMTILDGGLAWIDGLHDGGDIDSDGYVKVGDISLKTY